jgi:N-methylhydantoinase A/oxoprolinase/acetone carboxylase beta subunit
MIPRYGLGIDAGGTYTDGVILDLASGKVIAFAKALTTRPDPSAGIRQVLAKIDKQVLPHIQLVSLATTFATNAIVEDQGAEAGLILVGYEERPPEIPMATKVLMIGGGHTVSGDEKKPLDIESLRKQLGLFLKDVDAVAVAGFFSVRNSEHELRVGHFIQENYDIPVVLGHQLSMRLDAVKRATTAWWNARLIPLVRNLIRATLDVLRELGISAPLMVVRGDGTLMSVSTALDRPIDTLLSGPAASILGARFLSSIENGLIVDMGGTTTDMALLVNGRVAIHPQGAQVGKWKTHVEAAKVRTIGLGGDSLIAVDEEGRILVGPRRVIPLCLLAEQYLTINELLEIVLQKVQPSRIRGLNPCSFFVGQTTQRLELVSEFLLLQDAAEWSSLWRLKEHEKNGDILWGAMTPTDIRVATGQFHFGNQKAARLGLAIFSKYLDMSESIFGKVVEEEIHKKLLLEAICLICDAKMEDLSWVGKQMFREATVRQSEVDLDIGMRLTSPVVGVGAPAGAYLPAAFRRLETECILPEPFPVACAVGAVVGMVNVVVTGEIRPTDSRQYSLHTSEGKEVFDILQDAVDRGKFLLEKIARHQMLKNDIIDPLMDFSAQEKKATISSGEELYLATLLRLQATGRPNVWKQEIKLD